MKTVANIVIGLIIIASIYLLVGCVSKATSNHFASREIEFRSDGTMTATWTVRTGAESEAPGPTSQPTTAVANDVGSVASASGMQDQVVAIVNKHRDTIFYTATVLCVLGAAACVWFKQYLVAGLLGGAAFAFAVLPKFIDLYAGPVGLVLVILGITWAIAKMYHNWRETVKGVASGIKLNMEGASREATAALRETPAGRTFKR